MAISNDRFKKVLIRNRHVSECECEFLRFSERSTHTKLPERRYILSSDWSYIKSECGGGYIRKTQYIRLLVTVNAPSRLEREISSSQVEIHFDRSTYQQMMHSDPGFPSLASNVAWRVPF